MSVFFTYIFNHKHYKEVQSVYAEIKKEYGTAYKIWAEHHSVYDSGNFESKEFIANSFQEIKTIHTWIGRYSNAKICRNEGLSWFLQDHGMAENKELHYNDYKLISDNISYIGTLQGYWETYKYLLQTNKEAVNRFISSCQHSHDEIKKIALEKKKILDIANILNTAHLCENKYKQAWRVFSNERKFDSIPISELRTITENNFDTKERFVKLYKKEANLIKLILGTSPLAIDSFEKKEIEQEEELLCIWASRNLPAIDDFTANIHLNDEKELKRAILDSLSYGVRCNFSDDFTISDFYNYRNKFDEIGVSFDDAVEKKEQNKAAIQAYNKKKYGKSVVYILDYYDIVVPESELSVFAENYKKEQDCRETAKRIQRNYNKGFAAIYGNLNPDTCDLSSIMQIINDERSIQIKDNELEELERQQREAERRRIEAERKQQELNELKSCVNSWPQPYRSVVNCFSLYYYYPTTCGWDASEREWDIRNLIWDFKANPNRPQSDFEIQSRHKRSMNEILPLLRQVINKFFGSRASKLTLVCIPSSKKIVTERRYKDFSENLCSLTGMKNGYDYVYILNEGEAKHLGGVAQAQFSINSDYFKDKYVILFDDVITSGRSMENFKRLLEASGAKVIAGLSIGKTRHEREFSQPIDNI